MRPLDAESLKQLRLAYYSDDFFDAPTNAGLPTPRLFFVPFFQASTLSRPTASTGFVV
jgi:hypothetical protein